MAKKRKSKSHYREVYQHYRKMGYSPERAKRNAEGCYIATAVYGSYDCPEVWTLRRYRDTILKLSWYGRLFIKLYYAISPKIVKRYGNNGLFLKHCKKHLDKFVAYLNEKGTSDLPYIDQ